MTEDTRQKEARLRKELAQLKGINANKDSALKPSKDFSIGLPPDTTVKKQPDTLPDVVVLPKKRGKMKENIPF